MKRIRDKRSRRTEISAGGSVRRKNLNIDQDKLDRAKHVLGAATETDTIDQALDLVLFRDELVAGVRRVAGTGGVENVFDGDEEP